MFWNLKWKFWIYPCISSIVKVPTQRYLLNEISYIVLWICKYLNKHQTVTDIFVQACAISIIKKLFVEILALNINGRKHNVMTSMITIITQQVNQDISFVPIVLKGRRVCVERCFYLLRCSLTRSKSFAELVTNLD